MRKIAITLTLILCIMSSCIKKDDVKIVSVDDIVIKSFTRIELVLTVENKSGRNITLKNADFIFQDNGIDLLQLESTSDIFIKKKSVSTIRIPFKVHTDNPFGLAASLTSNGFNFDNITVTGEVEGKTGIFKKKFRFKDRRLS